MKRIFGMIFTAVLLSVSAAAFAHEHRMVAGKYEWTVGFLNEPAFSGQMNGLDLRVTQNGEPVEGLEETLRAAVRYEDETESLPLVLKKRYKQPGSYAGYFLPSKPGKYTFEISGAIIGVQVKETFVSGGKFHNVEDSQAVTWPK